MVYSLARRYTYEEVKAYVEGKNGNGCKLLSKEYTGNRQRLKFKCNCGNEFGTDFMGFKKGKKQCGFCSNRISWNYDLVKQFIEIDSNSGCKLLSKTYSKNTDRLEIQCACGEIFYVRLMDFKTNKQYKCGRCIGKINWNFDKVKEYIESLGYELISQTYINNHEPLIIKNKSNYYCSITLINLQQNTGVLMVSKTNPYSIYNINLWCKINNKSYKLLSKKYINAKSKLKWKCLKENCQEEFEMSWTNVYRNRGCPFCAGKQTGESNSLMTKNINLAKEWHPVKNGKLTPNNVTCSSIKKVWWECKAGHEWKATIASRNNDKNCPYCSGRLPSENYNLQKIFPELCEEEWDYNKNKNKPENYTPYSGKKVWWICSECNHNWLSTIGSRTGEGNGCPVCNLSKGEKRIKQYLSANCLIYEPQYIIDDCRFVGVLPYDFAIFDRYNNLSCLIEYDGEQHFRPVNFGGISDKRALINFKDTQRNDKIKNDYCKTNNIPLFRIPYWGFNNIEQILDQTILHLAS